MVPKNFSFGIGAYNSRNENVQSSRYQNSDIIIELLENKCLIFLSLSFSDFSVLKIKNLLSCCWQNSSNIDLFHENSRSAFFSRILLGKNCLAPLENGIFIFMIQMVMSRPIVQFKFIVTFYLPNFEYGRVVMLVASIFISSYRWKTYETIRVNTKL